MVPYNGLYYIQIRENDRENSYLDMAMLAVREASSTSDIHNLLLKRKSDNPHEFSDEDQYNNNVIEDALKENSNIEWLAPILAKHSFTGDVREPLEFSDDNYAVMRLGNTITLAFPSDFSFQSKEIIFVVEGFYVPWVEE